MLKRCWMLLVALFFAASYQPRVCAAPAAGHRQPQRAWSFRLLRRDQDGNPHTSVFLRVNGQQFLLRDASLDFRVVQRQEYQTLKIPVQAATACTGWWAGQVMTSVSFAMPGISSFSIV